MSAIPPDLEGLRRRIDDIDTRLHDLLIERAEIVARVATSKRSGNLAAYRPGREAAIIRRLAARRPGRFPIAALVRMWREMLAAGVQQQAPFTVAVFAPDTMPGLWDLARDHYGSATPMAAYGSAREVIGAVGDGAAIGVLPMPDPQDPDPWWPHLLACPPRAPQILARLPFGPRGNARSDGEALAIGFVAPERSGEDRTLFAVEAAADTGRARILAALSQARLACTLLAVCERDGRTLALIEVDGFVPAQDPRLDALAALFGRSLHRVVPLGGYALPLPAETGGPLPDAAKG
jgi:chorismate mutase/prephenate dehydratase